MGESFDINNISGLGLANFPSWILAVPALIFLIIIWSLFWKGLALWRAGQRGDKIWFVVLLVVNTMGILEIVYYFLIAGNNKNNAIQTSNEGIEQSPRRGL